MKKIIIIITLLFIPSLITAEVGWIEHTIDAVYPGAWGVYAIDMDGDKDIDIVSAAHESHEVTWWENDGNQAFTEHSIVDNF